MNRVSMTVFDRGSIKRVTLLGTSLVLLMACYFTFIMPSRANAAACAAPSADYGTATTTVTVGTAATYRIWSRIMAADSTNNSYLLEIDGNTCYVVGDSNNLTAGTWTWVDYQNGSGTSTKIDKSMTAGSHTIKMIGREAGVKLGRVLLISDTSCVPVDAGDNCATVGDTVAPTVVVSAPAANSTAANTVSVTANASDNVAVSKVEFYVNGVLKATDTASPYAYSWDSKTSANGVTSLMAKAYDAAGNSNSDTVQVQVSNGDIVAPSVPTGVTTHADAANKVTVKWTASTDNTAVAGYWVARDGQTLAKVLTGTQYIDTTVLPNTTYAYKVSAFDATGNTSVLSAESKVTTPNVGDTQAPSVPVNLAARAINASQINLTWTASTDNVGVAAYDVYRAVGNGSATKVATVTSLSYGDTGLAPSTSYAYYVMARDVAGNVSQKSTTVSARTKRMRTSTTTSTLMGTVDYNVAATGKEKHAHVIITVRGVKRIYDTDGAGRYTISDVPAGTYNIRYQARGSYSKVVTVKVNANQTKTQNVTLRRR